MPAVPALPDRDLGPMQARLEQLDQHMAAAAAAGTGAPSALLPLPEEERRRLLTHYLQAHKRANKVRAGG